MLGMASGIFIVPVLTIFGHIEIHRAIGASLVSVIACSCGGAAPFLRSRLTNIRLAIVLEVATTLGALTGVLLAGLVPVPYLFLLFALILFLSAQQMLAKRREFQQTDSPDKGCPWAAALKLHSSYLDRALGRDVHYEVQRLRVGLTLMYGAGLVSALLGIGSGVLKIPAMAANQGILGNVEFHDRGNGNRERDSVLPARQHCSIGCRAGRPGLVGRGGLRRPPSDAGIQRKAPVVFRRCSSTSGCADVSFKFGKACILESRRAQS
jgi:hypothetical protein